MKRNRKRPKITKKELNMVNEFNKLQKASGKSCCLIMYDNKENTFQYFTNWPKETVMGICGELIDFLKIKGAN